MVLILINSPSLVEFYPLYEAHMRKSLRAIVGEKVEKLINIGMAKDGSGVGGSYFTYQCDYFRLTFTSFSCAMRPGCNQERISLRPLFDDNCYQQYK